MNKMKIALFALALLTLSVGSCKKSSQESEGSNGEIKFSAAITSETQVGVSTNSVGNTFETEDAIGVSMFTSGQSLSQAPIPNRRYVFNSSETFSAQQNEDRIFFPGQGRVDFVAYHPYQDGAITTYQIDVADQSDLRAIDLLRGSAVDVDGTGAEEVPRLLFRHELSKVVFNITGLGIALNGLTVRFNNINSRATFDLASAQVSGNGSLANISARVSADGSVAEAILLPGEMGGKTVTFTIGNSSYTWTMPTGLTYSPATRYTYAITRVGNGQGLTEVKLQQGSIADWIEVVGETITLSPGGDVPTEPGTEVLLYEETFATTPTVTTALIGNYRGYTATGFLNGTITYSNVGAEVGFGDIRSTTTISPSLWLPANRHVTFQAAGLDAAGARDLRLTFDIAAASAAIGNTQNADNNIITVNFNGTSYSLPPITFIANNGFVPVSIPLTSAGAANSILQLLSTYNATTGAGNTVGIRVDNVRLYGIR